MTACKGTLLIAVIIQVEDAELIPVSYSLMYNREQKSIIGLVIIGKYRIGQWSLDCGKKTNIFHLGCNNICVLFYLQLFFGICEVVTFL